MVYRDGGSVTVKPLLSFSSPYVSSKSPKINRAQTRSGAFSGVPDVVGFLDFLYFRPDVWRGVLLRDFLVRSLVRPPNGR